MKLDKKQLAVICVAAVITVVLAVGITLAATLSGDKGRNVSEGDFSYRIQDGKAEITEYRGSETDLTLPSEIKGVRVAGIGREVFKGKNLRYVTLPQNISYVGTGAFAKCDYLLELEISGDPYLYPEAFADCGSLKTITLSETLTSVGAYCFRGASIAAIDLKNVKSLGEGAFSGCTSLKEIDIEKIENYIPAHCFEGCTSLLSVKWSDTVVEIGDYAFKRCYSLASGTPSEPKLELPTSLQRLGTGAFAVCNQIQGFKLPAGVKHIGGGAFTNCSSNFKLDLTQNAEFLQEGKYILDKDKKVLICTLFSSLSEPIDLNALPDSVVEIAENCFGSITVRWIKVKPTVKKIGARAFADLGFSGSGEERLRIEMPMKDCVLGKDVFKENTQVAAISGGSIEAYVKSVKNLFWEPFVTA